MNIYYRPFGDRQQISSQRPVTLKSGHSETASDGHPHTPLRSFNKDSNSVRNTALLQTHFALEEVCCGKRNHFGLYYLTDSREAD